MSKRKHVRVKRKSNTRKYTIMGVVLVLALALILIVVRVLGFNQTSAQVSQVSVDEAHAKYQSGVFLLDVREQEEWDEYHVPNTTLIPLDQLPDRLGELPSDEEIVVICRSGNRSKDGAKILLKAGFTNVTSMAGGLKDWSAKGYPLEGTRP
jgi:rhodanese-related sulfurtransferase